MTSIMTSSSGNHNGGDDNNDNDNNDSNDDNNAGQDSDGVVVPPPPEGHVLVREGQISMVHPKTENSVFYNPVQVQNRDLSVLMLGMYAERRAERSWTAGRRKEVRKEMMTSKKKEDDEEEGKNENKRKKEEEEEEKKGERTTISKEERRARAIRFERDLDSRVAADKLSVDFVAMTRESSSESEGGGGGLSIFEALAASGLRSLRYWKEVLGVRTVVVNDLDPVAVEMARENVARNGLEGCLARDDDDEDEDGTENGDPSSSPSSAKNNLRPRGIKLQVGDATHEMYVSRLPPKLPPSQQNATQLLRQKPQFDVIDLDPYGSSAPFLDAALQAVVHGGMLAVTCTDMAALGGSHPETCYGRYGAFPVQRGGYLQELALRILLYHMSVTAGRYGRTIRPILSVGMDFYCRVFVEVYDDKAGVNNLSLSHGHLFQSTKCSSFHIIPVATNEFVDFQRKQNVADSEKGDSRKKPSNVYRNGRGPCSLGEPTCGETGAPYKIAGPLWIGPLHDTDVVEDAIARLESAMRNDGINPSGGSPIHPLHTASRLHGLLVSASEELPDVPLYHVLPDLCSTVNSTCIPMRTFRAALVNAGYRVSAYHKEPQAVKTDAPNFVVWDVVRAWCKDHPPAKRKESKRHGKGEEQGSAAKNNNQPHTDVASKILSNEMRTEVDFTIPKGFDGGKKKAKRWALNPEANWGPKKAASGRNKRKMEIANDKQGGDDEAGAGTGGPDAKQSKT